MSTHDPSAASAFACLVCGDGYARLELEDCKDYYQGKPFVVNYVRCASCGLLQQHPLPSEIAAFYDDYPIHKQKSALYRRLRDALLGALYFDVSQLAAGAVILDYGCGDGSFLAGVDGARNPRLGYEPNAEHAARLAAQLNIPVYSDADALVREQRGKLDAVTLHFVLEHLTDLHGAFARIAALLKPGGTLYIVVPDASSFEARLFGRFWHGLDPPRHISFPDRAGIDSLAARHGFTRITDRAVPFPNGIAGSIPAVVLGRFQLGLFALSMPIAVVISRLTPSGAHAFCLKKPAARSD